MPVLTKFDGPYLPTEDPSSTKDIIYGDTSESSLKPTTQRDPVVGATICTPCIVGHGIALYIFPCRICYFIIHNNHNRIGYFIIRHNSSQTSP